MMSEKEYKPISVGITAKYIAEDEIIYLFLRKHEKNIALALDIQEAQIFHHVLGQAISDSLEDILKIPAATRTHH